MFKSRKKKEEEARKAMEHYITIGTPAFSLGEDDKKDKPKVIHAKCKLCGITDFKDNMVEITKNLEIEGQRRGYDVHSESSSSSIYYAYYYPCDHVHAKCMGITKSDDEAGWNFKKKPLPVKEEK